MEGQRPHNTHAYFVILWYVKTLSDTDFTQATVETEIMDKLQLTEHEILVPFHDVDPMNIVWHGHYAKYFEVARCVLLDNINYDYRSMAASNYAWPVVDMRTKYIKPISFDQTIIVQCYVKEWEYRLKICYEILDAQSREKLTSGYTIQVAVDMNTEEMCYESPDILYEKLGLEKSDS